MNKSLVALLFVLVSAVSAYGGHWMTDTKWQSKWNKHLDQDSENQLKFEREQREREHGYSEDREALQLDMQARMADLGAAIADSGKHADSLQDQLNSTRSALQQARNAAKLAGVNQGAAEAALVLSDLYSASIHELQRVAGTADQWYEQAAGCNRFYEAVKAR